MSQFLDELPPFCAFGNSFCFMRARVYIKLIKWYSTISSRGTTSHKDIKTRKKDKDVAVPPPTPFDWQAISADCRAATPQQLSISHEGENQEEEGKKKNCRLTL